MIHSLPDIMGEQLTVVFCGINPGLSAAASGHHFAGRGNRFWRVVNRAGFTPVEIHPEDDRTILQHQCGLTTLVARPTARADQVSAGEFLAAGPLFEQKIARYAPRCVAFLGKAAYGAISSQRDITWAASKLALPTPLSGSCPTRADETGRLASINWWRLSSAPRATRWSWAADE
jgi:TDG/mug DNA glycosylase family protein